MPFGVAVLGKDLELVLNARKNIEVTWNFPKAGRKYTSEQALKDYSKISEDKKISGVTWWQPFFPQAVKGKKGYLQSALENPKLKKLSATYQNEHTYHGQMEPMNATALVDASGKRAEIWAPTQAVSVTTFAAAGVLKTSPQNIKVNTTFLGGGFGRRAQVDYIVDAVLLSKITKQPIKVVWTREDDVSAGAFKPNSAIHIDAAYDSNGKIEAWSHRTVSESPLKFYAPKLLGKNGEDILAMSGAEQLQYKISAQIADHVIQDNGTRLAPWRGIGHGPNKFASECFMDEIASSLKQDPAEFRVNSANNPRTKAVLKKVIEMFKTDIQGAIVILVTISAVLATDLLKGVGIGFALAMFFILRKNYELALISHTDEKENETVISFAQIVSFLKQLFFAQFQILNL